MAIRIRIEVSGEKESLTFNDDEVPDRIRLYEEMIRTLSNAVESADWQRSLGSVRITFILQSGDEFSKALDAGDLNRCRSLLNAELSILREGRLNVLKRILPILGRLRDELRSMERSI